MDCVIPGHSVRPFCASIGCLSRIGKDVYVEFDPIDGLFLRTLNDAKSAFACFHYEPSFFERCTAPPVDNATLSSRKRGHSETAASDSQEELRFSCRVALRALAAVVRPRKGVVSLRVRNETSSSALYLSFEFHLRPQNQDATTLLRVVHRMKAADASGLSAVAPRDSSSEIVSLPKVLLRLLEPLKKTAEAALVVRSDAQVVSASSFHHADAATGASNGQHTNNNAILQATTASLLKTETAVSCEEFDEFDFREDRAFEEGVSMPDNVNSEVTLVFPIKETKSMLQFCSQAHLDQELRVALAFHWGGKPIVFETQTESFSAQLVLATLDYKLVSMNSTMSASATINEREKNQQSSDRQ